MTFRPIVVSELTREYDGVPVVDRVSFEVSASSIFGLIGPNGAGKTTTMKMLTGLIRPTAGSIRMLGKDFLKHPAAVRRSLGHVYANMAFYPHLSGEENLRFFGRFYGFSRPELKARIEHVLDFADLLDARTRHVGAYSSGMKQRLGIAKALLHDPEILLFDEATNGVDVEGTEDIRSLMFELRVQGKTTVITSHRLDEIELLCDRIAILDKGRIVASGGLGEIRDALTGVLFKYVVNSPQPLTLDWGDAAPRIRYTGQASVILSERDLMTRLAAAFPTDRVEVVRPTFEEVCLWILRKSHEKRDGADSTDTQNAPLVSGR